MTRKGLYEEDLDRLYDVVEEVAVGNRVIDIHKIEDILLSDKFTITGFGNIVDIENAV